MKVQVLKIIKGREDAIASGLAALLIIVGGLLVLNYFAGQTKIKSPSITPESTQTAQLNQNQSGSTPSSLGSTSVNLPTTYTVVRGDSLSKIAKKFYGDGNRWTEIAKANHLARPNLIHAGNILSIPQISAPTPAPTASTGTTAGTGTISTGGTTVSPGGSYTVVRGDSLWSIAIRAYGSGLQWYRIEAANSPIARNSAGKPLIFPGQVLKIP